MSVSIPAEKITEALIEDLNDAGRSVAVIDNVPTIHSRIQILVNVLIYHGIVSPPAEINRLARAVLVKLQSAAPNLFGDYVVNDGVISTPFQKV